MSLPKLTRNSVVAYRGGGYEGCLQEWNYAYIGVDGKFYSIYNSGSLACKNRNELRLAMQEEHFVYRVRRRSDREALMRMTPLPDVKRIAEFFLRRFRKRLDLQVRCAECDTVTPILQCEVSVVDVADSVAGPYAVCPECYCESNVVSWQRA